MKNYYEIIVQNCAGQELNRTSGEGYNPLDAVEQCVAEGRLYIQAGTLVKIIVINSVYRTVFAFDMGTL